MLVKKFKITDAMCNNDGSVRLSALQYVMQECAGDDFNSFGTTDKEMRKNGMAFVLARVCFDFYNEIRCGDTARLVTFHDRTEGISMIREFYVSTQNGLCCRATSVWIILNLSTRRLMRPNSIENCPPSLYSSDTQVSYLKRIFNKDDETVPMCDICITGKHIDVNGHVNNTYYQDFIAEALEGKYNNRFINHIQISYVHEAFENDTLCISGMLDTNTAKIMATNNDSCCFEAIVTYTEKQNGE